MLGTSTFVAGSSGDGGTSAHEGGGESEAQTTSIMTQIIGDDEKPQSGSDLFQGDRSTGGNRWPRQETIALIKIRSDMDVTFRDSSLKAPLWEQVSRKMAELGYHRSAKKCKEKFENVYKYHKRTKDGRVGKSDGKTYRFFDQLEALEHHHLSINASSSPSLPPQPSPQVTPSRAPSQAPPQAAVPVTMIIPAGTNPVSVTVPSTSHPISIVHTTPITTTPAVHPGIQIQMENPNPNPSSPSATQSSSSTSSDEELLGRRKRKRKWKDYFERLVKDVIDKQEELQKRFLEAVEKREHDRVAREESWKIQEMARLNREHDILVQERSVAAAKDAALIAFLQKLSDQQQIPMTLPVQAQAQVSTTLTTTPQAQPQLQSPPQQPPQSPPQPPINAPENPVAQPVVVPPPHLQQAMVVANTNNGDNVDLQASSSRWPKAEVEALINLRTCLDQKYQDNGPKGPLWEEISSSMKKLGYNRNAKRCKEKWENINKYFKKVKESNKKRPEDSKTCPYFHQLEALYKEKNKVEIISNNPINTTTNPETRPSYGQPHLKHEGSSMAPIMAEPEQQWPPLNAMEDQESENQYDSEDDGDEEDDDDQGNGYEIVANNNVNEHNNHRLKSSSNN